MGKRLSTTAFSSLLIAALLLGMTVIAPPKASALTCVQKDYLRGSTGTCVKYIQYMINRASGTKLKLDGKYGNLTHNAVMNWQALYHTTYKNMLVDGIVGDQTWATLCSKRALYPDTANNAGCKQPTSTGSSASVPECDQLVLSTTTTATQRVQQCTNYLRQMLNVITGSLLNSTGPYNKSVYNTVIVFQASVDLKKDGITGKDTWHALCTSEINYEITTAYGGLRDQIGC